MSKKARKSVEPLMAGEFPTLCNTITAPVLEMTDEGGWLRLSERLPLVTDLSEPFVIFKLEMPAAPDDPKRDSRSTRKRTSRGAEARRRRSRRG